MTDRDRTIEIERKGVAGLIRLNRPEALNALTLHMVREISGALQRWQHDEGVRCVIVTAVGKAFCAGGDIRWLYDLGRAGRFEEALTFWREEYALNLLIKRYTKPYIALIDGMVMGGGVGISLHGSHRVSGPNYRFAMPEVGIGFIPDVGATHALSRLPDAAGTWLALTGARIDRDAARALGLVTHTASTDDLDGLVTALAQGDDMTVALAKHAPAGQSPAFLPDREAISRCFAATDMASIIRNLTNMADTSGFAARCLAELQAKSPLSLAIALEQMRLGTRLSFEEALAVEFRIVSRLVRGSDFYEGVRALIVDKDNAPHWSVAGIADVDKIEIAAYFAPLGELELWASHPTDDEAKPHHARP